MKVLALRKIPFKNQVWVPLQYKGIELKTGHTCRRYTLC
ncbi:MAG: hypothetical protein SGI83_10160 [Bacteroidota bacterium]|nr:hypothetical protein [Bacteroidota bacterium]